MSDVNTHDQVVTTEGQGQSGVASSTQSVADPVTGATTRQTTTRMWSGKSPGAEAVWLIAGVIVAFLALDFVFHAFGANSVGFAAFVFSVGSFFAAPFAGIFNTSTAGHGNLVIWADVLAMVIYGLLAMVIVKVVAIVSGRGGTRTM
jgi:hypothetical protein